MGPWWCSERTHSTLVIWVQIRLKPKNSLCLKLTRKEQKHTKRHNGQKYFWELDEIVPKRAFNYVQLKNLKCTLICLKFNVMTEHHYSVYLQLYLRLIDICPKTCQWIKTCKSFKLLHLCRATICLVQCDKMALIFGHLRRCKFAKCYIIFAKVNSQVCQILTEPIKHSQMFFINFHTKFISLWNTNRIHQNCQMFSFFAKV